MRDEELNDGELRVSLRPTVYIRDKSVDELSTTSGGRAIIAREFMRLLRKTETQSIQIAKLLKGDNSAAD